MNHRVSLLRPTLHIDWKLPDGWEEAATGDGTVLRMAYKETSAGEPFGPAASIAELILSAEILTVDSNASPDIRTLAVNAARTADPEHEDREVEVVDLPIGLGVWARWHQATSRSPLWRIEYWILLVDSHAVLTLSARAGGEGTDGDSLAGDCLQVARSLEAVSGAAGAV
jgi:hypothetical protein